MPVSMDDQVTDQALLIDIADMRGACSVKIDVQFWHLNNLQLGCLDEHSRVWRISSLHRLPTFLKAPRWSLVRDPSSFTILPPHQLPLPLQTARFVLSLHYLRARNLTPPYCYDQLHDWRSLFNTPKHTHAHCVSVYQASYVWSHDNRAQRCAQAKSVESRCKQLVPATSH